jgi:hypothetical protein
MVKNDYFVVFFEAASSFTAALGACFSAFAAGFSAFGFGSLLALKIIYFFKVNFVY